MPEYNGNVVRFSYPDNWDLTEEDNNYIRVSSRSRPQDPFREYIAIQSFTNNRDLYDEAMHILKDLESENGYTNFNGSIQDDTSNFSLGSAKEITFTRKRISSDLMLKGNIYVAKKGAQYLTVDLYTTENEYQNYSGIYGNIKRQINFV